MKISKKQWMIIGAVALVYFWHRNQSLGAQAAQANPNSPVPGSNSPVPIPGLSAG